MGNSNRSVGAVLSEGYGFVTPPVPSKGVADLQQPPIQMIITTVRRFGSLWQFWAATAGENGRVGSMLLPTLPDAVFRWAVAAAAELRSGLPRISDA